MKFTTASEAQTKKVAFDFAKSLKPGDIVALLGEVGAGKTVFAKGFAKGLGIDDEITSPTYMYLNDYNGILYHYDCYRIESGDHARALGLDEYFYAGGICLIEWAENIADILPKHTKKVMITKKGKTAREIKFL